MTLEANELMNVKGGSVNLTAAFLSAVVRGYTLLFEMGQAVGSALHRAFSVRNRC